MSETLAEKELDRDNLFSGTVKIETLQKHSHEHYNGDVPNTTGSKQESDESMFNTGIEDTLPVNNKVETELKIDCSDNTHNKVEDIIKEDLSSRTQTEETKDVKKSPERSSVVTKNAVETPSRNIELTNENLSSKTQTEEKDIEKEFPKRSSVVTEDAVDTPSRNTETPDVDLSSKTQIEKNKDIEKESPKRSSAVTEDAVETPSKNTLDKEEIPGENKNEKRRIGRPLKEKDAQPEKFTQKRNRIRLTKEVDEEESPNEKKKGKRKVGRPRKEKDSQKEKIIKNIITTPWTKEEDQTLVDLVDPHKPCNWQWVATQIKTRTPKQCKQRWVNHFAIDGTAAKWSEEEDIIMKDAYDKYGPRWKEIALLLPGRSESAVMQHWRVLLKRKRKHDRKGPPPKKVFRRYSPPDPSVAEYQGALQLKKDHQEVSSRCVNVKPDRVAEGARKALLEQLVLLMPDQWVSRVSVDGAYALRWAPGIHCAVQRAVFASFDGSLIRVIVHSEVLRDDHELYSNPFLKPPVPLNKTTVKQFAAVIMSAVNAVQEYKLCAGICEEEFVEEWGKYPMCRLDEDLYGENAGVATLRVIDCYYLVPYRRKRCPPCRKYYTKKKLQKRLFETKARQTEACQGVDTTCKGDEVRDPLVAELVATESLPIDRQLARGLEGVFKDAEGIVKLIWEEQNRANAAKKSPMVKWHPLVLRWALKKRSSTGENCFVKVTPQRTLYEYCTVGVHDAVVKRMAGEVGRSSDDFKKYVVVGFDEVCILRNVVYRKATGRFVGYVKLDEVEDEIAELEEEVAEENVVKVTATTMLAYFVKGVANGVRGVVAGFEIEEALTEDVLYTKTWDVIWDLETAEMKVIALVGDGGALCQAFFNRHTAFTATTSGVVYDTLNTYANGRPIFFFNDIRNLLKLIRNCFANSGAHKKTRLLMKNGEVITWQTIVDIFKTEGNKCEKLKGVHVFLNSHSVTEVFVAAQVMSRSVAACIEQSGIPNTKETVKFIRFVNDFYDCLNGASEKPKNENLAPYRSADDARFVFLMNFLHYLEEWKAEVDAMPIPEAEKQKRKLSVQTLIGIERTIKAFIAVVKFLLEKRSDESDFISARVFQLDDGL